jgi:transcriptional regulator with XRE-family HTH domain
MTSTKKAFGAFVTAKRQAAGLTQRDLAQRLFVTESAVSKWERGVSYPDISLVAPLAGALGVNERELIHATDDHATRRVEQEARSYRRWRGGLLRVTTTAYLLTLVVCLIVNGAVSGGLDWFWVVLAAVALAASLTTLPLLPLARRGWTVLAASLTSLVALLVLVRLLYGSGPWLPIALTAILLAVVVVIGPVALRSWRPPSPLDRHRTVLALAADTVMLGLLLLVVMATRHQLHLLVTRALPIAGLSVVYAWATALVVRYLPVAALYRAALVAALLSLYTYFVFLPLVPRVVHEQQARPVDLSRWHDPYLNGNIALLVLIGGLLVATVLAAAQALRPRRESGFGGAPVPR